MHAIHVIEEESNKKRTSFVANCTVENITSESFNQNKIRMLACCTLPNRADFSRKSRIAWLSIH